MITNREIISRIRNTIKEQYKDSVLTNKHIWNIIKTSSSFLLNREANKSNIYSQSNIWQTLCVEMIQTSAIECLDLPVDCKIWRSKMKLPRILETNTGFFYKSITSPDGSTDFLLTTSYQAKTKSQVKYNKQLYVWIENEYLYSFNAFPYLTVIGYFEADVTGKCSRLDDIFYFPLYLTDAVVKLALQELMTFKQLPYQDVEDKNPNA